MLDAQEFFADSVRLEPMNFCKSNLAVTQFYSGNSFQFSPTCSAEFLLQKRQNADFAADGNNFYVRDFTENFKIHLNLHQHQNRIL